MSGDGWSESDIEAMNATTYWIIEQCSNQMVAGWLRWQRDYLIRTNYSAVPLPKRESSEENHDH